MKPLNEILNIEGIVIRSIPEYTYSKYKKGEPVVDRMRNNPSCLEVECSDERFVRFRNTHNIKYKFVVGVCSNIFSTVKFDKRFFGVGDTIEKAYEDYCKKTGT